MRVIVKYHNIANLITRGLPGMMNKPKTSDIIIDFESMLADHAKKQDSESFDFFGKNYTVGVNGEIFSNELCDLDFPDYYLDPPGHLN